jgi:uncharacterized protein YndB with AHSA1/START domain
MELRALELVSEVVVSAPPDRLWEVFADAAAWPRWSRVIASVEVAPERWAVGARLAFRLRIGGAVVPFDVTVTRVEPPWLVRWSSVRWSVTGTRTHRFDPVEGGTRVADHKRFEHGLAPLRWVYPRAVIRRMSSTWLADLAAEVARRSGTAAGQARPAPTGTTGVDGG